MPSVAAPAALSAALTAVAVSDKAVLADVAALSAALEA